MLTNQPVTPVLVQDLGMMFAKETSKNKYRFGIYRCACGKEFRALADNIKRKHTVSCGCYHKKQTSESNSTHGNTYKPLYNTWRAMIRRTSNVDDKRYKDYGANGITVCEAWKDFNNFNNDMFSTYEKGLTLDRVDTNGNYEPSNCRWATASVQVRNTRIIYAHNTSGYRGVYLDKRRNRWVSRIVLNNKGKFLGSFSTALEAAITYDTFVVDNSLEHTRNGVL